MPEVVLTLRDVEARLNELQEKYGITTAIFEQSRVERERISDEDEFEWEAFIEHRAALLEQLEAELHREYIQRLNRSNEVSTDTAVYYAGVAA